MSETSNNSHELLHPTPATPDHNLLIISDLHLSEGIHPSTKRFSRNEDFFFDEEFARFLAYYSDQSHGNDKPWHLIINGDFLDFLQVTSIDDADESHSRDPERPKYGLGCGEGETVHKLDRIMEGHKQFFKAMAKFIVKGHSVTIMKGNHDVEFHYMGVRDAFIKEMQDLCKQVASENAANMTTPLPPWGSLRFSDWFYYEPGLLWVEHGNQSDEQNCFRNWLEPLLPADPKRKDEIDLPFGSLFVRYLFNRVENEEPFADNIKPPTKFVSWFLLHHPIHFLNFARKDGLYMLKKIRRAWKRIPDSAYADRDAAHHTRLVKLASLWNIKEHVLENIDKLRATSVFRQGKHLQGKWKLMRGLIMCNLFFPLGVFFLFLTFLFSIVVVPLWVPLALFFWGVFLFVFLYPRGKKKKSNVLSDLVAEKAKEIFKHLDVRYVIMGHSHNADLQSIDNGGKNGKEYFNTGTWTKVFSEEERLIREENELVFVKIVREEGLKVELLKWEDNVDEPRRVKLFEDLEESRQRRRGTQAQHGKPSSRSGKGISA